MRRMQWLNRCTLKFVCVASCSVSSELFSCDEDHRCIAAKRDARVTVQCGGSWTPCPSCVLQFVSHISKQAIVRDQKAWRFAAAFTAGP